MKASDYNLTPDTMFDTPDDYVAFDKYLNALQMEAAYRSVQTGEFIPYSAIVATVSDELNMISPEQVASYRLVGQMITIDRELNAMTPEERDAYERRQTAIRNDMNNMAVDMGYTDFEDMLSKAAERFIQKKEEIDNLNNLFNT